MADQAFSGRIEPFLFDRLANRGRLVVDEQRRRSRAVTSKHLREFVDRDLVRLFGTPALETVINLEGLPRVARSCVNFGLPMLSGRPGVAPTGRSIENAVRTAIERFEPRLIRVRVVASALSDLTYSIRIDAELWSQPVPERYSLEFELDVISGIGKVKG